MNPKAMKGVAQGSPTSPILANLIMNKWLNQFKYGLGYADDSIGDREIKSIGMGIDIHPEKSGWVKKDGKWLKPLKFLGLVFDGRTNSFQAETRNGSLLKLTSNVKSISAIINHLEEKIRNHEELSYDLKSPSWEAIFKSKLIGFIQNRMYSGSWDVQNMKQDFTFRFERKSWCDVKRNQAWFGDLDIFNSSSYACESLAHMLRWNQKFRLPRRMPDIKFVQSGGYKKQGQTLAVFDYLKYWRLTQRVETNYRNIWNLHAEIRKYKGIQVHKTLKQQVREANKDPRPS
jgi:hypothetical protein